MFSQQYWVVMRNIEASNEVSFEVVHDKGDVESLVLITMNLSLSTISRKLTDSQTGKNILKIIRVKSLCGPFDDELIILLLSLRHPGL